MKQLLLLATVLSFAVGCSSSSHKDHERKLEEREHEGIKRDYTVTDASSNIRPGWVEDAEVWAAQNRMDSKTMRYFSFETEPKVSRQIACELARANSRADIAAEITTFINRSLADTSEGSATIDMNQPAPKALKNYVETTLVEKVQALIYGSSVLKTYWEKRQYTEKLGAKADFTGYTCAVFLQMDSARLSEAVDRAADMVLQEAADPALKEKVKKALEQASEDFNNLRKGQI